MDRLPVAKQENHVSKKIWEVNKDRLASMQRRISDTPRLLRISAGRSSCSIFRVPQSLIDINGRSYYHPHIVSIGPYHHGAPHLKMFEEHKWRFLGNLLDRTQSKGLGLEDYLKAIQPLEIQARECYSETINFNTHEFIEMLVVDGCFILELFRKIAVVVPFEADDPLFSMPYVSFFLSRDLIRLENQIPFFILQNLFELARIPGEELRPSLANLALEFFSNATAQHENIEGKHLLDLVRSSLIPQDPREPEQDQQLARYKQTHVIQCVSKLRKAGIKLEQGNADSFLVIKFKDGVIEMPTITIDDFMSHFLINCVAYEQCHGHCSMHMTTYATLLDCLINSARDVEYLCDRDIMENHCDSDEEVAKFINNLGKDVTFDLDSCYLSGIFKDVNAYYKNRWHVHWASFMYTYFHTPWAFISAFAAIVLLVLATAQTFFTILSYVRPK